MTRILLFPIFLIIIIIYSPAELYRNFRDAIKYYRNWVLIEWASFKYHTEKKK